MSINSVTLVGRTTRDPKIVENKNGGKTVLFTVAVERNYKDSEGNRPTDFVAVKAFKSRLTCQNGCRHRTRLNAHYGQNRDCRRQRTLSKPR